jgi:predicted RNase H-like HicB family nuclease
MAGRSFPVVLVPQPEGGYFVQCPTLPGCYSQGETVEESLVNIREAIELALEDLGASGQPIPQAGAPILTEVTVAA